MNYKLFLVFLNFHRAHTLDFDQTITPFFVEGVPCPSCFDIFKQVIIFSNALNRIGRNSHTRIH